MKQTVLKQLTTAVAVAAVISAATAPLRAEDKVVTLPEIIASARENNGELKALREEAGIGQAVKIKAALYPNPVLELEGTTGALTGSPSENIVSIGISQEFLLGGKREKRLAVAEAELEKSGSRIKDAERLLLLELKTGFCDLLLAEGRLELARKSQELNSHLLQITKERLAAGDIAELDLNLAKVEAARSEERKIEAEHELVQPRQRLLALSGAPALKDLKIGAFPEIKPIAADLAGLTILALKNRPDLQAAAAEQNRGEAEIALARAERLPNLTAGIAFSRESSLTSVAGLEEHSTDYLIGLKLSLPIPLFDRNQAAVKESQIRKNSAGIRQEFVRLNIEREVETAYSRLAAAEKSLKIYTSEIMPQLTENLKLFQEAYRLGEMGILAVIEEQKKFNQVNEGYLSALYNRNTALAKLEAVLGIELSGIDGGRQ